MTQEIMMVVEENAPIALQAAEFVRGGGSSDYEALSNKPSINSVELVGNKTAADLSLATADDVAAKYTKPNGGIPDTDIASAATWNAKYAKPQNGIPATDLAEAVQTSLGKADTALQSAPVTSVNGQTGAVTITVPSSAADVGAVSATQGAANANKFLVTDNSGNVTTRTLDSWQGGSY